MLTRLLFYILKKNYQKKKIVNVNDDEENFNKKRSLQND